MARPLNVAVIGAGASGLSTARELQSEGHRVVIYEKANQIGGTWLYTPETESEDPLGVDPNRKIVHSSSYASLRANLPRQLMGFPDYPFRIKKNGELMNFPGHEEILRFFNEFSNEFGLVGLIRFNTEVVKVEQMDDDLWVIESRTIDGESSSEEMFQAVVVCNGHYSKPKQAQVPGIQKWPGKQIHSHNYRVPELYRDQVVILIGSGPSAYDICEEISAVAKEVHLSSRWPGVIASKVEMFDNVWLHCEIDYCHENGKIAFQDGATVAADTILHCTGFQYDFPFLKAKTVIVDNNRVGPLYKHVFPPQLAPGLSFIGIPYRAPIFLTIYLQAKWVAHVLSGKTNLPSEEDMVADVEEQYSLMEENGVPKHHTHSLLTSTVSDQTFEYLDWLGSQVGVSLDKEIKEIYSICFQAIMMKGLWSRFRNEYIKDRLAHTSN